MSFVGHCLLVSLCLLRCLPRPDPLSLSLSLFLLQVISWHCFLPLIYLIISKFALQTRSMWNATFCTAAACMCACVCVYE